METAKDTIRLGKILIIVEPDGYKEFIACSLYFCVFLKFNFKIILKILILVTVSLQTK